VERAFQSPGGAWRYPANVGLLGGRKPRKPARREAYRGLRTKYPVLTQGRKAQHRLSSSVPDAGEGKFHHRGESGHSFAQRPAYIGRGFRPAARPTLHKLLHVQHNIGLNHYLLKTKRSSKKSSRPRRADA